MKAIVYFKDGLKSLVIVNSSYSISTGHFYNLTINSTPTFLSYSPGEIKVIHKSEILQLIYVMD